MEKRDFDDIMLGGEDIRSKDSKKMLLLIIAIVVLVLAIAIIVVAMGNAKGGNNDTIVVDSPTSADSNIPGGGFNNVPLDDAASEDRFDQIVRDIKNSTEQDNAPIVQPEPPKATMPNKPSTPTRVATTTKPSAVASASTPPRRTMNRLNNGDIAENGYYLQVGAFSKTPNRAFLDTLNNYSYRTQEIMINSNVITRYLVGPYKSREEAQRDFDRVARDIGTPVYLLVQ